MISATARGLADPPCFHRMKVRAAAAMQRQEVTAADGLSLNADSPPASELLTGILGVDRNDVHGVAAAPARVSIEADADAR